MQRDACDRTYASVYGAFAAFVAKLSIEIRRVPAVDGPSGDVVTSTADGWSFDRIWERYVEPLTGRELIRSQDHADPRVDGSGVRRVTTGGTTQRIAIGTFRWVIDQEIVRDLVKL
ncbi:MAG TPA: hypothetical protein VGR11_13740 [Solirubrobacteraceae bacterium]|nr:hypothetical protein [Solirubrobacteraceae bacterium]